MGVDLKDKIFDRATGAFIDFRSIAIVSETISWFWCFLEFCAAYLDGGSIVSEASPSAPIRADSQTELKAWCHRAFRNLSNCCLDRVKSLYFKVSSLSIFSLRISSNALILIESISFFHDLYEIIEYYFCLAIETGLSDSMAIAAAKDKGVGLISAQGYYLKNPKQGEFVFGYAQLDETDREQGIQTLARVFKRASNELTWSPFESNRTITIHDLQATFIDLLLAPVRPDYEMP